MWEIPNNIQLYLNEIAEKLSQGRAAVMIGAGFSKNAVQIQSTDKRFLNWNELGDLFYEKIHRKKPDDKTGHYLDAMRLAGILESTLGRPVLDQILLENLPDEEYGPSDLHKELLKLNWVDIFTTNYDTLLERARKFVTNRKYQIVTNTDELVYSHCPRIIKLHGSFPSGRPFVISQEDYRKYPQRAAAFVNTVQQALLENVMCLIGFSGDDPNFLNWIGWIRDNLGEHTSKIYLITFDLSPREDDVLLASRNIVIINMADCFDSRDQNSKIGYKEALSKFIYEIQKRQSNKEAKWTLDLNVYREVKEDYEIANREANIECLDKLYKFCLNSKQHYPDWVIIPYKYRYDCKSILIFYEMLLMNCYELISDDIPSHIDYLDIYSWLCNVCLLPLSENITKVIENILIRKDSFDERTFRLCLSILEYYRCNGLFDKHSKLMDFLKEEIDLLKEQRLRLEWELAYTALYQFDFKTLENILQVRSADNINYDMEIVYTGFMWECDLYNQGFLRLVDALNGVRYIENTNNNIKALSQEAYIINLFDIMTHMETYAEEESLEDTDIAEKAAEILNDYREQSYGPGNRRDFLKLYDCYPEIEMDFFKETLCTQRSNDETNDYYLTSVQFIKFLEKTGMRMIIDPENSYHAQLRNAILNISKKNLYWAIVLSVRTRDQRLINDVVADSTVASYSIYEIKVIVDNLLRSIKKYNYSWNTDIPHRAKVVKTYIPVIISALAWHLPREKTQFIFDKVINMSKQSDSFFDLCILANGFFPSLDFSFIKTNLHKILDLILPFDNEKYFLCVSDCDIMFYDKKEFSLDRGEDFFSKLAAYRDISENRPELYASIIYNMSVLYYIGVLTEEESNILKDDFCRNLDNKFLYPLEVYYFIHDLVNNEEKICNKIQLRINELLIVLIHNDVSIKESYRIYKKLALIFKTYKFKWQPYMIYNILKYLEYLKKRGMDLKFSYLHQLLIQIICDHKINLLDCVNTDEIEEFDLMCIKTIPDSENLKEIVMEKLSEKSVYSFIEAAGIFYKEIKKNFFEWKDSIEQFMLILCISVKNETPQASFCVDMARKVLKLSHENQNQINVKMIADLLNYLRKLTIQTDTDLLLKANAAKMAYDISCMELDNECVQHAVKEWEKICINEETPAFIRKQWYDIT